MIYLVLFSKLHFKRYICNTLAMFAALAKLLGRRRLPKPKTKIFESPKKEEHMAKRI